MISTARNWDGCGNPQRWNERNAVGKHMQPDNPTGSRLGNGRGIAHKPKRMQSEAAQKQGKYRAGRWAGCGCCIMRAERISRSCLKRTQSEAEWNKKRAVARGTYLGAQITNKRGGAGATTTTMLRAKEQYWRPCYDNPKLLTELAAR